MPTDAPRTRSRRSLLTAAVAGAATAAVGVFARPLPASAATGDPLLAGQSNQADAATSLSADAGLAGPVAGLNVTTAAGGPAITGVSPRGNGLLGISGDTSAGAYWGNDTGVVGIAGHADALSGVHGDSDAGVGVIGTSGTVGVLGAGALVGVLANSFDTTGTSLFAVSSTYPLPQPAPNTAAHVRRSVSLPGHALFVDGRLRLKWSGRVSVAAGLSSKKISVTGMTSTTMVFAMFQSNESGAWIRAAVPASGSVTFYFSKAMPSSSVLAWMAVG